MKHFIVLALNPECWNIYSELSINRFKALKIVHRDLESLRSEASILDILLSKRKLEMNLLFQLKIEITVGLPKLFWYSTVCPT